MKSPFRYFDSSPEVIRLVVMMYVKYPLSLRNVEDFSPNVGSISAMKPSGCGGTVSAHCSRPRYGESGLIGCGPTPTAVASR